MSETCIEALYIYLCAQSNNDDISSIRGHDNMREYIVVQERVTDWLIGPEIPDTNRVVSCCANKIDLKAILLAQQHQGNDRSV